jgi:hypothetical protein
MTVGIENLKQIKILNPKGFKHILSNGRFVAVSKGVNAQGDTIYALQAGIDEKSHIGMALSVEAMETIIAMYIALNGDLTDESQDERLTEPTE